MGVVFYAMQRAWLFLLASCGFHSPIAADPVVDAPGADAEMASSCWATSSSNPVFQVSACLAPGDVADTLDISSSTSIDTDGAAPASPGVGCAPLTSGDVCALVAKSIVIRQGATLSAHGKRPLALLGHDIDIEGTVDVASHSTGGLQAKGPAADRFGCNSPTAATGNGGGPGGTYDSQHQDGSDHGGDGGDGGGIGSKGGNSAGAIGIVSLLGGCPGGPSSGGIVGPGNAIGGHGGGAVWIAADTGMLVIGDSATINASGAGGAGGMVVSANRGGYGGGSGGLIVLQAAAIALSPSGKIFANGGGGGGGGAGTLAGNPGADPVDSMNGGAGGNGSTDGADHAGDGGQGFPAVAPSTKGGNSNSSMSGGGGGGGGTGAIRVHSTTLIRGANVSPPPVQLID